MFGDILKQIRIDAGLKQSELADKLNISTSTIGMYEQNRRNPDPETLKKIATYFDVSVDFLLEHISSEKILSKKAEKDIAKKLDELRDTLESQSGLLFSGDAMDDETREFLLASLERTIRQSKVLAKEKFTPNKYKK